MDNINCSSCHCELLDRLVEVMHYFHCEEPEELENLLRLPKDSLTSLFRTGARELPVELLSILGSAGVRKEFITSGSGSLLSDTMDSDRLEVMKRHAAHLLKIICKYGKIFDRQEG